MNPFLSDDFLPDWDSLTPDQIVPGLTKALEDAQAAIDEICRDDRADYDATFAALEEATERIERAWGLVSHLNSVMHSTELREAMNEMLPKVAGFSASIPLNEELYRALRRAADSPSVQALTGARRRFVDETLAEFVEQGADLPADRKERLMAVKQELAEKTQKFAENVLDATNAFEKVVTDEALLAGLPESARAAARQSARESGHEGEAWRFTLHVPSYLPVQKYAENEDLRAELYRAFYAVGSEGEHDNTDLIWEILALRQEQAELLGKAQFADVVLERRMAKNGATALAFVEDLHDRVLRQFLSERRDLHAFAATGSTDGAGTVDASLSADSASGPDYPALEPWQASFYQERLRRTLFDLDDEELRPYFPITQVIAGLFELTGRVFGIQVVELSGPHRPNVWHPEVRYYELRDSGNGEHLGSFYADWHPRESKRAGAWVSPFSSGERQPGLRTPHLAFMCGNLTAPVGDADALLTHDEVRTIFHEFGHMLHHQLGEVEVKALSGTSVAWDFVELPSQIMENWIWQRESLDLFARHHESGELIPDELFDRMIRARNFMSASLMMRQLHFGKLDLELHVNYTAHKGRDLDEVLATLLESYLPETPTPHPTRVRSFNHLFSNPVGYAAGYYSYKWAEVLEADAFTRFLNEGILSERVGREFRDAILSKGNSKDAAELFRDFMGRDPQPEALLLRDGLA